MLDLNTIWFLLIGVLIVGYAILDGFDLGVGVLHLFTKGEKEKRTNLNAIGPVWDGNEVWLLTAGGALFAAFPAVYATVFTGFYLALMLLLVALIFRAVAMEFRSKVEAPSWRNFWDKAFGIGSLLPAILFGVAVGNILRGVPVDANGTYTGTFLQLLNPYSILIGLVSLAFFVAHGAIYLTLKAGDEYRDQIAAKIPKLWAVFEILYLVATFATVYVSPFLFEGMSTSILFWVFIGLLLAAIGNINVAVKAKKYFLALISSSATIAAMIGLAAVGMFPRLVPSSIDLRYSLTATNSASSEYTLTIMLIIAAIGVPIVLAYTFFIYRVFKGKVVIGDESY